MDWIWKSRTGLSVCRCPAGSGRQTSPTPKVGPSVPARAPDPGHNAAGVVPISERELNHKVDVASGPVLLVQFLQSQQPRESHEQNTIAGRHEERRVHFDRRRQTPELGSQRPALRGLRDLPRQRLAR